MKLVIKKKKKIQETQKHTLYLCKNKENNIYVIYIKKYYIYLYIPISINEIVNGNIKENIQLLFKKYFKKMKLAKLINNEFLGQ